MSTKPSAFQNCSSGPGRAPPPETKAQRVRLLALKGKDALGEAWVIDFKMGFEQRENARHGGEDGDALGLDEINQARSGEAALEMQLGAEDGGNPEAHHLAEDVAERQRVKDAQGMNDAQVLGVGPRAVFNGTDAGEDVAVGENDAFGIAC